MTNYKSEVVRVAIALIVKNNPAYNPALLFALGSENKDAAVIYYLDDAIGAILPNRDSTGYYFDESVKSL